MHDNSISLFLLALNLIVNNNHFEAILNESNRKNHIANVILQKKQTKVTLAKYFHTTCISLVQSTFIKAIKNNHFISWLGLTTDLIQKNLLKVIAIIQGHQKSERWGL